MKQRIEIESLTTKVDPITGQMSSGLILRYKKDNGQLEQLELEGSTKDIMDIFSINDLTQVHKKKVDLEVDDQTRKLKAIHHVDERIISYTDFERLENKVNQMINLLKKAEPKT